MNQHICTTEDGPNITCLCTTGRDHNEYQMDNPHFDQLTIYGTSDDLIEAEGLITEEFGATDDGGDYIGLSNGWLLHIEYGSAGIWRITPIITGPNPDDVTIAASLSFTGDNDANGYTDRAVCRNVTWMVVGTRYERVKP